jgi:hypothetical protein
MLLTAIELRSLQAIVHRAELSPAPPTDEPAPDIAAGDVVQIRPFADHAFGGMLAMVMKAEPYQLRGYLLRPHRGGCREAWLRLHYCDVERIGRSFWPADSTDFARRCDTRGPDCAARRANPQEQP